MANQNLSTYVTGLTENSSGGAVLYDANGIKKVSAVAAAVTLLQNMSTLTLSSPAANTTQLSLSGYSVTGAATTTLASITGTWNTSGAPTALLLNVTNTASNVASLLMDLQVGGASQFNIRKDGATTVNGFFAVGTTAGANYNTTGEFVANNRFALGANISSPDIFIGRNAAASLRLGAADAASPVAQTLGVQSVVAGTSNTAGAAFTIAGSKGTGTGAGGSLIFQVAPAGSSGSTQNSLINALTITSAGVFTLNGGAQTWTFTNATGNLSSSGGNIAWYAGGTIGWNARGGLAAAADGVFTLYNNALSDFSRLQFGGTTSAFGAIARDGAGIKIVGADGTSVSWTKVPGVAVASLPAAATAGAGARSFVTDALSPVALATVAGGGAVNVPVFSDGSNWKVG
jgi:hypothetical protein